MWFIPSPVSAAAKALFWWAYCLNHTVTNTPISACVSILVKLTDVNFIFLLSYSLSATEL